MRHDHVIYIFIYTHCLIVKNDVIITEFLNRTEFK